MKLNKTHLFIAILSAALFIVLAIQVNWILQTAKIKEQLFNEKANMVLSKTAEAMVSDSGKEKKLTTNISDVQRHKVDSLLAYYMGFYNIHIDYYFEVKPNTVATNYKQNYMNSAYLNPAGSYQTCIGEAGDENALDLKLVFPKKRQFILAEMGTPFITSVILILLVLVMSWRTILSLSKEKKIFEHTTDFLNNMTHEFKTPLTNIALAGKMIGKDFNIKRENKIKHYSAIILEENEKLRHQVEQVLSMSALERGEIPLKKTEFDFHRLIQDVIKYIHIQIESKEGQISLNLQANDFLTIGDKTHFTNALCNLIDNSIKYSQKNPNINIETKNISNKLVVIVSDLGIGIEKAYQRKVFDKFFRVPTGDLHNVKGFGLGLAYVKNIVESHSGTIELMSEKGKGTTFTITLPHA